jgi:hypothetical protein
MALASLALIFRLVEDPQQRFPVWAQAVATLLSLKPIIDDLTHGNVNLFILFLVVLALYSFRRNWDLLSGLLLGLAIACKLTPALFLPYFVWKRAWRTLAAALASLALFLYPGYVPALRLGSEENHHQLVSWYAGMVKPYLVEGKVTSEHSNQSLPGVVARLATHSPSFSTWVDDRYTPTRYDNLLDLPTEAVKPIVKGCLVLFALLAAWACRTPTRLREGVALSAEFSVVLLGMLLFSERTWKHHAVTLAVPFAVLCYAVATRPLGKLLRAFLMACLLGAFGLVLATGLGAAREDPWGPVSLPKLAQVYGSYTAAFLLLLAGLVVLLRSKSSRTLTQTAVAQVGPAGAFPG